MAASDSFAKENLLFCTLCINHLHESKPQIERGKLVKPGLVTAVSIEGKEVQK